MFVLEDQTETANQNVNLNTVSVVSENDSDGNIITRYRYNNTQNERSINKNRSFSVSYIDIGFIFISIILRILSLVLNFILASEYYFKGKLNYFAWTICCIIIPMIITTVICITMYMNDTKNLNKKKKYGFIGFLWFVIVMPFLFRFYQSLIYAIESKAAENRNDTKSQKRYFEDMIREESDVTLIRIFECFLEAAPQKVLQISIILSGEDMITWMQIAAISGCLGSMTWCIVVYHKYNRYIQPDKENISNCGATVQCLWHFFIAVSRILSISIIASIYPLWTLIGCICHAFVLGIFVFFYDSTKFCSTNIFNSIAFSLTLGIVYIFAYITPKDGPTRYKLSFYYIICVIENCVCLTLFISNSNNTIKNSNYFIPLCIFSIVPYFIGIFFMILYYKNFHPNILARQALDSNNSIIQ